MQTHVAGADYKAGVVAGAYQVAIEKLEDKREDASYAPPKDLLPVRYKNPQSSGFTATVSADGPRDFAFPLEK